MEKEIEYLCVRTDEQFDCNWAVLVLCRLYKEGKITHEELTLMAATILID